MNAHQRRIEYRKITRKYPHIHFGRMVCGLVPVFYCDKCGIYSSKLKGWKLHIDCPGVKESDVNG